MASVVEIMGYSTSPDLQRMFKYCFVFQCSDGQRFQFGVSCRPRVNAIPVERLPSPSSLRSKIKSQNKDGSLPFKLPWPEHRKNGQHTRLFFHLSHRFPFSSHPRIENLVLPKDQIHLAKQSFNKQVLYRTFLSLFHLALP
jgi:hypothetical protein